METTSRGRSPVATALRNLACFSSITACLTLSHFSWGQVLEEVIVNAQKREQSLQDIPFSVSAVSGQEIEAAGIENIFNLANIIPTLDITQNAGPINTSFRIRRIGNEANIPNFEPAVGLFIDGAFRNRSGVAVGGLVDIERVEVLRGPQSTLYGKNTTAGVINIVTRRPTEEFEVFGEITAGIIEGVDDAPMTQLKGSVSGPLIDGLKGRLSGTWTEYDPLMDNLTTGGGSQDMTRYTVRGQLLWDRSERWDATLIGAAFRIDDTNTGESEFEEGITPAAINEGFGVPCPVNDPNDRKICWNRSQVNDLKTHDLTLLTNIYFDSLTLASVTSFDEYEMFRDLDADQLNIHALDFIDRQDSSNFSQEFRLSSADDENLSWLAGLYYFNSSFERGDPSKYTFYTGEDSSGLELAPGIPFGQEGYTGILDSTTDTDHYSVFGQLTWRTGNFELTAGARWMDEEKESVISNSANHSEPSIITVVLSPSSANSELQRETDDLTWSLSGQYYWDDDLMLYATASRGFKSGGFNAGFGNTPVENREFDDETVQHMEIGAKMTTANDKLRVNLSVFNSDYTDYQAASFISLQFLVNNAEEVTLKGFEADISAILTDHLTTSFGASYVDAEYDRYPGGSCYPASAADDPAKGTCVLSGQTLPFAPKWKTSWGLMYERTINSKDFYSRLDWSWSSDYDANTNLDPRHVQDSYSLVNLRGGMRISHYDFSLWVENATDESYVIQDAISNLFDSDPAYQRYLGMPRSYGITARARF